MHDVPHMTYRESNSEKQIKDDMLFFKLLGGLEIASADLSTDDVPGLAPLLTTPVVSSHPPSGRRTCTWHTLLGIRTFVIADLNSSWFHLRGAYLKSWIFHS